MNEELLAILACPMCRTAPLRFEQSSMPETLSCSGCGRRYNVENGIPNMLPEKITGDLSSGESEWSAWSGKIENFIQWRKMTWNGSAGAEKFKSQVDEIKEKFIEFTGLRDSGRKIIDIGCGDGGLRTFLRPCKYCGVDPLLIEGCRYDFPMVRAVGEHLPFRDGSFDEAILNQVLDHCNSIDGVLEETVRVIGINGTVNIMQFISEPDSLLMKMYGGMIAVYLTLKGVKKLDTKTSRFSRQRLADFFRRRFKDVKFLDYSESQVFVKASVWKKDRK